MDGEHDEQAKNEEALRILRQRANAYRRLFSGRGTATHAKRVLEDLAEFCHANKTVTVHDATGRGDPIGSAFNDGARRVYLRIQSLRSMKPTQMVALTQPNEE